MTAFTVHRLSQAEIMIIRCQVMLRLSKADTAKAPRHLVASLGSRIAYAEGVMQSKVQLFKDMEGDALMNDDDQLSLPAQTYPGCAEDDPMAVVCEDVPQEDEDEYRFLE